ncbi:MAG: hypothetical protein H0U60_19995 [Blastocatellia bacterium]|nr:hypothetical protein [Blastocatellia bacterium]
MAKKTNKYLIDGEPVPSVTTILGAAIAKPELMYWYGKHGTEKCEQILESAGEFGSAVHSMLEQDAKGQKLTHTDQFKTILENFKSVTDGWEWLEFEKVLINKEHRYGGTIDAIAKVDGKTCLVDFKTSSGVYPDFYVQVAAYRECLPEVERCFILHLDKDTNGWELLHAETEGLFEVFLAAKKIYNWKTGK